ncbi:MAG: nucleotidyltransferase domain-containing protein [Pseudomonadota bacterium]|nr:nucleotidyltransferase domain-containing protein [Gammaproteobacteria bacterium]MBU1558602.1 nucleotidyltransferase domain-containing protein [Gammaproteobacteria bacterium]MBU1926569.1 nucleotidyltransferase domain-containing protein [Gammaproteobacteria bacterium]MBU2546625.1 nucleotidyltransferase domain-containing protein [Gammaproteobacteria bacterium]
MIEISPKNLETVKKILKQYVQNYKVVAFGSRVSQTAKSYSDLDLAIIGKKRISSVVLFHLKSAFQESDLPFRVDILDWHTISEPFKNIISEKHIVLQEPSP